MSPTRIAAPLPGGTAEVTLAQGWLDKHIDLLIGVPLRILLIVVAAVVVRSLARRAINRFVERVIKDAEDSGGRRSGRGPAVLQRAARTSERRRQRAKTIGNVLSSIATVVIAIMSVAMVLDQLGIALGPLLASAGVVGLAIGFGAQNLVADYLSGLLIMFEDQYGVGDSVDLGEAVGEVEEVGLRLTKVRDLYGGLWNIRNGEILRVKNDSQEWARAVLDIYVDHDTDLDHAYRVLEETGMELREDPQHKDALLEDPAVWGIQSLDQDGILLRMAVKTAPLKQWAVTRELRHRAKNALDAAGITIAHPQRTVRIHHEAGPGGIPAPTGTDSTAAS